MGLLLILSPFAALTGLSLIVSPAVAMGFAALLAVILIVIDLYRGRSLKILQVGAALLFTAVATYMVMVDGGLSELVARAAIDTGLLVVALGSLALRFPFTLQYARETVDADIAARPEFHRANYVLTWVWTAAFVTMLVADLCAIFMPWLPLWTGLAAAFAARSGASYFTQWYAAKRRAKYAVKRTSIVPAIVNGTAA